MEAAAGSACAVCGRPSRAACARCHNALYCGPQCQRADWRSHKAACGPQAEVAPLPLEGSPGPAGVRRAALAGATEGPGPRPLAAPRMPPEGLPEALAAGLAGLPEDAEVLVRWPTPRAALARRSGIVEEVPCEQLARLAGSFDCVVDAGELERSGLVMSLAGYRWDVLGRVEEALRAVGALLALVRPGGCLLARIEGQPLEYLVSYLEAFPVELQPAAAPAAAAREGWRLCRCAVREPVGARELEAVLARELLEECSHRRYAEALDAALPGARLEVLDVGGGDGHMAEWWAASGHSISLLEVDAEQARKAEARLGKERVTLHDGCSKWPFADGSFDVCLLLFVLHHIAAEAAVHLALSEAARVSRRQVLVLEDQPRDARTQGLRQLAAAVTAEHFRPFKQDPSVFMRNIRADSAWRELFAGAGLRVEAVSSIPGTLQHPVPHTLYTLAPAS